MTRIQFIQQTPILTVTVTGDDLEAIVDNKRLTEYLFPDKITYQAVETLLNRVGGHDPRKSLHELIKEKGTLKNSMFPTIDIKVS